MKVAMKIKVKIIIIKTQEVRGGKKLAITCCALVTIFSFPLFLMLHLHSTCHISVFQVS